MLRIKLIACYFLLFICIYLIGCSKTKDYGRFYSLKEAYEQNIISYDDLLTIAYYNNGGVEGNENYISNDFIPKVIEDTLDSRIEKKIKATIASSIKEYNAYEIYEYYGTYNKAIVIKIRNSLVNIPAVETEDIIVGIKFIYPTYPIKVFVEG